MVSTLWPGLPTRWRVSAAWARRAHDCTLAGIAARCGGGCCANPLYWPVNSSAGGRAGLGCEHLGPQGCRWGLSDRPVTCLLYPLMLNKRGTLVLHARATTLRGICKGNHGQGPPLVVALAAQLTALFGGDEYERIRASVLAGRDCWVDVPALVLQAYELERAQEPLQEPPVARGTIRQPLPVLEVAP